MTASEGPGNTVLRARLAQGLSLLAVVLILLSIFGVEGVWTLVSAAVLLLVVCYLDGSLVRWWRRDRRRPSP